MSDPFFDERNGVLKNRWELTDPDELQRRETAHSAFRMMDLPKVRLTFAGYKKLHKHIFQDVYPWAGKVRPTTLAKGGPDGQPVHFLPPGLIEPNLRRIFDQVGEGKALRGLSPKQFADISARLLDEVNHVHAFREGNGRTQRALLWRMGQEAGYKIDLTRISRDGWMAASISSDRERDHRPMSELIEGAMVPGPKGRQRFQASPDIQPTEGRTEPSGRLAHSAGPQDRRAASDQISALRQAAASIVARRDMQQVQRQLRTDLYEIDAALRKLDSRRDQAQQLAQRIQQRLPQVYQDPAAAGDAFRRHLDAEGLDATRRVLQERPGAFGKMRGRGGLLKNEARAHARRTAREIAADLPAAEEARQRAAGDLPHREAHEAARAQLQARLRSVDVPNTPKAKELRALLREVPAYQRHDLSRDERQVIADHLRSAHRQQMERQQERRDERAGRDRDIER